MDEENKNLFDKTEEKEQQLNLNGEVVEENLENLKEKRKEILDDGSVDELEEVDEKIAEAQEEADELKAPSLDDLDDIPQSQKYRVFDIESDWDENKVMTIERVRLQPPRTQDMDGNIIHPETSANGKYYKSKLILEFAEEVDGNKLRQSIPSIYYGINENEEINKIPGLPQACSNEELNDKMTSSLAKVRNLFCKHIGKNPKDVSNKDFAQGLVGKKVKLKKESGKFQGRKWAKLVVKEFV